MTPAYGRMPYAPPVLETAQGDIPLKYSVVQLPDEADAQVAATIRLMQQYVCEDCQSGPIKYDAAVAVAGNPNDPLAAVHSHVRSRMFFKSDEASTDSFRWMLPTDGREHRFIECLRRPIDVSFEYANTNQPVPGDCDCQSLYCAALLKALGIDCAFVTIGASTEDPTVFSHIYVCAFYRGQRVYLDCSHGQYAGWHAYKDGMRYQEWPVVDRSSWGALGLGIALAGYWAWRNRREIREWMK